MNAREMILNHASLSVGDPTAAIDFLKGAVSGAAQLVKEGVVGGVLRADRGAQEIYCAEGFSLFDVVQELRRSGARDEHLFFTRMVTKTPLLDGIGADDRQRFLGCETRDLPPEDGAPLLLCALTHAVAVGFPTHEDWDRDRVTVRFEELLPDGTFSPESEDIDHLARATHAAPICARHRQRLRAGLRPGELWKNRGAAFPNLAFGPDVESHLEELPAGLHHTVVNRLGELDAAAGNWRSVGGGAPSWPCKVTNESERLRNDSRLTAQRRFRSRSGQRELFLWHARFGSAGRIHLRFDPSRREVEIGYIGGHLPL